MGCSWYVNVCYIAGSELINSYSFTTSYWTLVSLTLKHANRFPMSWLTFGKPMQQDTMQVVVLFFFESALLILVSY